MLKYNNYDITFQEIPDEVCLYITLTGCPIHCLECNSKWLWEDTGTELTFEELSKIIDKNSGITCIVFGGGDNDQNYIKFLSNRIRSKYPELKIAFYSGDKNINLTLCNYLDYYKIGPFDSKYGPLNNSMTNQRLYKVIENKLIDITNKFWR